MSLKHRYTRLEAIETEESVFNSIDIAVSMPDILTS
jgi:hypothetical protein